MEEPTMALQLRRGFRKASRMFQSTFRQVNQEAVERRRPDIRVRLLPMLLVALIAAAGLSLQAQEPQQQRNLIDQSEAPGLSEKDRQRQRESLEKELATAFKKWLNEDVGYIITDEERKVFLSL